MSLIDLIPAPYRIASELLLTAVFALACTTFGALVMRWHDGSQMANMRTEQAQERAAQAKAVSDQKDRNIELQRAAEKHYVVTTQGQDHFFTTTLTEIRHDAAPLAACPVPESVRVRLNAAAACARADSPAACGAAAEVPGAR